MADSLNELIVSAHLHHVVRVEITPLNGPYHLGTFGRDIKVFDCRDDQYPKFSFCIFEDDAVEWIIPDDVFEAELRRRGDLAAAKLHSKKHCSGCGDKGWIPAAASRPQDSWQVCQSCNNHLNKPKP